MTRRAILTVRSAAGRGLRFGETGWPLARRLAEARRLKRRQHHDTAAADRRTSNCSHDHYPFPALPAHSIALAPGPHPRRVSYADARLPPRMAAGAPALLVYLAPPGAPGPPA